MIDTELLGLIIPAFIAALGYIGKVLVESWNELRRERLMRRARLLKLGSLLRASQAAFVTQNNLARRLAASLPDQTEVTGFEDLFVTHRSNFDRGQAELHALIRGYSQHAMRPINRELAAWLASDLELRTSFLTGAGNEKPSLADSLNELDAHLRLWQAKYKIWIPGHPEHALVYLNDEGEHGPGFPTGIDDKVDRVLQNLKA